MSVVPYRVLPRWIDGRKGLPFSDALKNELRDVAARIHELIHWFAKAESCLGGHSGQNRLAHRAGLSPAGTGRGG